MVLILGYLGYLGRANAISGNLAVVCQATATAALTLCITNNKPNELTS